MTYLGVVLVVIGSLGLFASLIGLASLSLDRKTVHRYGVLDLRWSFILAVELLEALKATLSRVGFNAAQVAGG